jgi:hypothetical protein
MAIARCNDIRTSRNAAEQRREFLRAFLRKHGVKPKQLGRRGGFNPNAIYNFLKGISGSLSMRTVERMLSAIPGATADDLLVLSHPQEAANRVPKPSRVSSPLHPLREPRRCAGSAESRDKKTEDGGLSSSLEAKPKDKLRCSTIAEAKLALGAAFGVAPEMVEITIRG